jgi:hypothetical protein
MANHTAASRVHCYFDGPNFLKGFQHMGYPKVDVLSLYSMLVTRAGVMGYYWPDQCQYFQARPEHGCGAQRYLNSLRSKGIKVHEGYLYKDDHGVLKEKAVDTNIVAHMVEGACCNLYDTLILVSGDGDLAPGVQAARKRGKRVIIAQLAHTISSTLAQAASEVWELDDWQVPVLAA